MVEYKVCGFDPYPFEGSVARRVPNRACYTFYLRLTGELTNEELVMSQRWNGQSGGALACQRDILSTEKKAAKGTHALATASLIALAVGDAAVIAPADQVALLIRCLSALSTATAL